MKRMIKLLALALAALCLCAVVLSCDSGDIETETDTEVEYGGMPEYSSEQLSSYVKPFEYTGLTVYAKFGQTRQEALWSEILNRVEIIEYPTEQVEYYLSQERAKYRYFAKRDGIEYQELLEALGVTEESMREGARALVKDDLALLYIMTDAGITLSDGEVSSHTDKYAEKLSEIYGYDAEYVKQNMSEQIYDAMLSDKTMEFLLSKNNVYTTESK